MSKLRARRPLLAPLEVGVLESVAEAKRAMSPTPLDKLTAGDRSAAREFCLLEGIERQERQGRQLRLCQFNPSKDFCDDVLPYKEHCARTLGAGYVNASLMRSALTPGFIAAQGPLKSTVADFWSMVANHRVTQIVALCAEDECASYIPSDNQPLSLLGGTLQVHLKRHFTAVGIPRSHLEIAWEEETWEVTRLQCRAWADGDVPPLASLLRLAELVNADGTATTIVHCRAGAGRTGCLIALCTLLVDLERQLCMAPDSMPCTSVARIVVDLRLHRPQMVQTPQQYQILYDALGQWHQARRATECCVDEEASVEASTPGNEASPES